MHFRKFSVSMIDYIGQECEKLISTKMSHKSEQTQTKKQPRFSNRTPSKMMGMVKSKEGSTKQKSWTSKQKEEKIGRQKYFAKLQTLFMKNPSTVSQLVLWEEYEDKKYDPPCNLVDCWTEVIQEMSVEDNRPVNRTCEDILEIQSQNGKVKLLSKG